MSLILHLGYPKTATSLLQNEIFSKDEKINYIHGKEIDELYLNIVEMNPLTTYQKIDNLSIKVKELIIPRKINIISYEAFLASSLSVRNKKISSYPQSPLETLFFINTIFKDHKPKVLFSIRNQKDFLKSFYAENYLKYSQLKPLKNFTNFVNFSIKEKNKFILPILNYYNLVHLSCDIFGKKNIEVIVFEDIKDKPNRFISKLSEITNVNLSQFEKALTIKTNVRKTREGYKTRKANLLNIIASMKINILGEKPINMSPRLKEKLVASLDKNLNFTSRTLKLEYTKEQERQLFNHFKESNKKLDEEFNLNLKEYGYY